MNLLRFLLRASPRTVSLTIAAAVAGGLSTAGLLAFIRWWLVNGGREAPALMWAFVGLCLGAVLSKLLAQVMLIGLSRRAVARLLLHLSRGVLASPLAHLERVGSAHLRYLLTADVQALVQGLGALPLLCANAAIVAACLGFLAYLSMPVFIAVAIALGVGLLAQAALMRKVQGYFGRTREGQETVATHLQHMLEGIKEMKAHRPRREAFLETVLQESLHEQQKVGGASQLYLALAETVGRVVLFGLVGVLLLGLVPAAPGEQGNYLMVVFFLMQPLGSIKYLVPQLARARTSMQKLQALGLDLSSHGEPAAAGPPPTTFARLELAGVLYAYPTNPDEPAFTLGPLDVTFRPGEVVFLGGGNGSGKTTFAKLLTGLYAPKKGEVRLDGRTVLPDDREGYRQLFSVVFSEFHLLPGLIGLHRPDLHERARALLARFRLDSRVTLLNDGAFSTTTRLSRGQQKRLALIVALLEDRPFYVLDEWAADQDPHFRNIFYTELLPELKAKGKTVLAITHDERYFPLADRLLVLDEGVLREPG
jgi:putative ATP-binding cassette transporter